MATTGIVEGKLLKIYTGGSPVAITCLDSCSVDTKMDMRDTTCKDSGTWSDMLPGRLSWTMKGSGLFAFDAANGGVALQTAILARTALTVVCQTGISGDWKQSGTAYLTSFSLEAGNVGDNAKYSFEMQGVGELAYASS